MKPPPVCTVVLPVLQIARMRARHLRDLVARDCGRGHTGVGDLPAGRVAAGVHAGGGERRAHLVRRVAPLVARTPDGPRAQDTHRAVLGDRQRRAARQRRVRRQRRARHRYDQHTLMFMYARSRSCSLHVHVQAHIDTGSHAHYRIRMHLPFS